jgi:hypothetical protein
VTATLIFEGKAASAPRARPEGGDLWVPLSDLASSTPWELKPEGVCKGEICVPLSPSNTQAIVREENSSTWFNLTQFARVIDQPVAADVSAGIWYFGPAGWDWQPRPAGWSAPDFTAPDLDGQQHTLSEALSKKVFLLFWASW